jgi:nitroimidazol reductase NimA-like FMN-containing flavoprotein (pyridoxamine 5'-phosphate oxidase superfamily)
MTTREAGFIESLDRAECLRLLAAEVVGRVAVTDWNTPIIFPVIYVLDGEAIVFRSDAGTKQSQGPRRQVSFEIDAFDRTNHEGWSVIVVGSLEEVTPDGSGTLERIRALPIEPWARGEKAHFMRILPRRITGRRVTRGPLTSTSSAVRTG